MFTDRELTIRPIQEQDLPRLWELIYKEEAPEWKKWDAPYFSHNTISYERFMEKAPNWIGLEDMWVITVEEIVCGIVSYYFEDEQLNWLEVGIVFHEGHNWNKGLGTRALNLWIPHLFQSFSVARIGLTTWSGNERMMRVAEKLGMQLEALIRKVRFHEGTYYDSIRMGVLREEWEATHQIEEVSPVRKR